MSIVGNTAVARPLRQPVGAPSAPATQRPHLEIAPTRAQRRARPRLMPAIVSVAGIGVILMVQLLLSILLADGAYRIEGLRNDQRDLLRDQQALSETLELYNSVQNLTASAEGMGMVASGNPQFLNVATGAVSGATSAVGSDLVTGTNLIGNALLDGSFALDPAVIAAAQAAEAASGDTGAPTTPSSGTPVTSTPGTIPSPTTH